MINKKFKNSFSDIKVNKNIDKEIFNSTINKKLKAKLIPVTCSIICILILSLSIVYAKEIKQFVRSLGKATITVENKNESVELEEIYTVNTKVDNIILDSSKLEYNDVKYKQHDGSWQYQREYMMTNPIKVNSVKELENNIGIGLLSLKNNTFEYTYGSIDGGNFINDFHIGTINISSSNVYEISCINECDVFDGNYDKFIMFDAKVYTTNYIKEIENDTYQGEEYESEIIDNVLGLGINGMLLWQKMPDDEKEIYLGLYFNYNNVSYNFVGFNMEPNEMLEYIENNII